MRHPLDGTLRRLLDEPAAVADADRAHVADCAVCQAALATASDDAALADAVFAGHTTGHADAADGADGATDPNTDASRHLSAHVEAGWRRLSAALGEPVPARPPAVAGSPRRWRSVLRRPAVAAIGVGAVVSGAGVAAANDWLEIFRTESVATISVTPEDLIALPDLSAYGEFTIVDEIRPRAVESADAAAAATGLTVPTVTDLPQGVVGEPTYHVTGQATAEFTFDAAEAAATLAAEGHELPPPPAALDGSQFRFVAGPAVAAVWEEARGLPALVVARGYAPAAFSSGVAFETARDYLLALPTMPEQLAAQLRTFSADGSTLPIPLVAEAMDTSTIDIDGVEATVLTVRGDAIAGVVWVDADDRGGVVTVVGGPLTADDAVAVAKGLA